MRTLQHYWAPSPYEVSGHSAITIDPDGRNEFVAFWAILPDKTEGAASASYFNQDFDTDCRVIGLRKIMHPYFKSPIDPPSGIGIYLTLIDALQRETSVDAVRVHLSNWKNRFPAITAKTMSDHENAQIDVFCGFIGDYTKTRSFANLYQEALAEGKPTESIEINALNISAMTAKLHEFKAVSDNMLWAAQVGSQTDRDLADSRGNRMNRFAMFPGTGSIPGIKGYQKGKTRHNCSSLIFALLQEGGIDIHLKRYVEQPTARLREMIEMREDESAESKAEKFKKINAIGWLPSFSMARRCGTTPHELNEMCKYAEDRRLNPPVEKKRVCAMM